MLFQQQKSSVVLVLAVLIPAGCADARERQWEVRNPYAGVDWANDGRFKANFHTHTTVSDGRLDPHDVVDRYYALGYHVLAITDHNSVTFPWKSFYKMQSEGRMYEDRNPAAMGMAAVPGNELSGRHHMGSYFNDYNGNGPEQDMLDAIAARDGLAVLFHPGRYEKSVDWYVSLYRTNRNLIGLEVYNQGDKYPGDRGKWDAILAEIAAERPVWGFSNDDMHSSRHLGRNWNILLLPELSDQWVRRGMETGRFLFVYASEGHDGPPPPVIKFISVDLSRGSIYIKTVGGENIRWISNGKTVHRGRRIKLAELPDRVCYVRAIVGASTDGPVVGTQPFVIKSKRK